MEGHHQRAAMVASSRCVPRTSADTTLLLPTFRRGTEDPTHRPLVTNGAREATGPTRGVPSLDLRWVRATAMGSARSSYSGRTRYSAPGPVRRASPSDLDLERGPRRRLERHRLLARPERDRVPRPRGPPRRCGGTRRSGPGDWSFSGSNRTVFGRTGRLRSTGRTGSFRRGAAAGDRYRRRRIPLRFRRDGTLRGEWEK